MNLRSYPWHFIALCCISLLGCSKESSSEVPEIESQELLVGDWDFISEHSYSCATDEIETERPANGVINTFVFKADGTYQENEDGSMSNKGEWSKNENGTYKIIETENKYNDMLGTYEIKVEFDGENIMKWDVYGCQDNNSDTYVYARYDRKN